MKARDEYTDLMEAYMQVCEQQVGVPLNQKPGETLDDAAKRTLENILKVTGNPGKVVLPDLSSKIKQAEEYSVYDEVLEYLLGEGYSEDESNEIMVYFIEQGMPPQEVFTRGLVNMLGLDKPHPTTVFLRALPKVLWPNTPKPLQAPTPRNPPSVTPRSKPLSSQSTPQTPKSSFDPLGAASGLLNIGRGTTPAGAAAAVSRIQGSTPQSGPGSPTSPEARAARSQRFAQGGFGGRYIPPSQQVPSTPVRPSTQQPTQRTTSVPPAPTLPSPRELNARSGRGVAPTPKVSVPTPKPQDPDIAEYQRLQKIGDYKAADKLGKEISSRSSGLRLTPPRVSPAFTQIPPNVA